VAERLAQEQDSQQELVELALTELLAGPPAPPMALRRRDLVALQPANQRQLLQHWLTRQGVSNLPAPQLDLLLGRLTHGREPGSTDLRKGLRLQWDRQHLWLQQPSAGPPHRAELPDSP
jgi:hypothetical protein